MSEQNPLEPKFSNFDLVNSQQESLRPVRDFAQPWTQRDAPLFIRESSKRIVFFGCLAVVGLAFGVLVALILS